VRQEGKGHGLREQLSSHRKQDRADHDGGDRQVRRAEQDAGKVGNRAAVAAQRALAGARAVQRPCAPITVYFFPAGDFC
jgi:hypothetical protein